MMIRGPGAATLKTSVLFSIRRGNLTNKKQAKKKCEANTIALIILLNYCYCISIALQVCLGVCMTTCVKYSKMTGWS